MFILGFKFRHFLVSDSFCVLLLGTIFACLPANAGNLDRVETVAKNPHERISKGLVETTISGKTDFGTFNHSSNFFFFQNTNVKG